MWFLLAGVASIPALVYLYFLHSWKYWKNRNVESPAPTFPYGNVIDSIRQKRGFGEVTATFYFDFKKKNLRFGGFYFLHMPNLVFVDLDLIKTIMTKDFNHFTDRSVYFNEERDPLSAHLFSLRGQKWRNLRAKLTPTFTSGKMKSMFPILVKCSTGLSDLMDEYIKSKQAVDIKDVVARYTTDVIGTAAFGIDCDSLHDPDSQFRKFGSKIFQLSLFETIRNLIGLAAPEILQFFNIRVVKKEVNDFFMNVVHQTVRYRETTNEKRNDFMQLLIEMKKDEKTNVDEDRAGTTLTMNELAAQVFVFFVAGFETSSTTLTFCLYELARKLELQRKLRQEINDVLQRHNFELSYDALNEMTYMDKCINETLRMYPPVPTLNRTCTKTYRVPDSDLVVEKGTIINIPIFGIQRDPEIYPDPSTFDPERFSPENKAQRHPFAWLPFGEGPRVCIGLRFGIMQTKVALVEMLMHYNITLNHKTAVPLVISPKTFLLGVKDGVFLDVEKIV